MLVLPIHSPSALAERGAGAAPSFPPLPPHAANASIHDMAKTLIIATVLAFTIAPCGQYGGAPSLFASFRENAATFDRFGHFITFMSIDRSSGVTLDIHVIFL